MQHLQLLLCSEAECIVFAMEGLLLAHDLRSTAEPGFNVDRHSRSNPGFNIAIRLNAEFCPALNVERLNVEQRIPIRLRAGCTGGEHSRENHPHKRRCHMIED